MVGPQFSVVTRFQVCDEIHVLDKELLKEEIKEILRRRG